MIGNIFVRSWLIWAIFHTTDEHFFHQNFPLLSSDLKNVLTKYFPMQLFTNVLQIRCYCKFPDNHKKYVCWSLFLISALLKLQDWWPATLFKKTPQHRCFPVNVLKGLKKTFYGTSLVAAFENDFEEFLRISKGGLTWNDLYDLTNLNVQIAKSWQLSAFSCGWYYS